MYQFFELQLVFIGGAKNLIINYIYVIEPLNYVFTQLGSCKVDSLNEKTLSLETNIMLRKE